jgi:hypothetical protein
MKLEQIQYKVGLLVTGALNNTSYVKILNELGWQPLSKWVNFLRVSLLHKVVQGSCRCYFTSHILSIFYFVNLISVYFVILVKTKNLKR